MTFAGTKMTTGSAPAARQKILGPALVAALLGFFLLFGAGFAPLAALHNAAHDTRHTFSFPCH
ncbi:MAG: CbtB-domain containing protein [Alphaproteobacteria bacterium]|nr:CbtB-domain containing protein [Alphaproteobacteria bacterium]